MEVQRKPPNSLVIIDDYKDTIFKTNSAFLETLGYSNSDFSSLKIDDLVTEESKTSYREVIDETLSNGYASKKLTIKKKNQEIISVYLNTAMLELSGKTWIHCIFQDVIEQEDLETELYEANQFLDSIIENIPNMIFLKDAKELRFVRFNKAGEKLLGYSREDLLGKNDYDFFPEKEADFFTAKDKAALKAGKSIDIPEEEIHTKTKGTRTLHTKKISLHGEDGKPKYLLGISEDITEHKKAQEVLKKSNEELEEFVKERTVDLSQLNEQLQAEVDVRKKTEGALEKNFEQLSRKNRYQEIISVVTQSVHESIDLQTVLNNSIEAMVKNIDKMDNVSIYLVEGDEAVLKAHHGYTRDYLNRAGRIPYPKGGTWKTIIERKSRYVPDVSLDDFLGQAGKDMGFKCYLIVPMFIDNDVVGTVTIVSFEKNVFDEEELKLLEIVSKQISIAIKNARQAEALINSEERYRALYQEGPLMYFTVDEDGTVLSVNRNGIEKLGYTEEQLIGHSVFSVFLEEDKPKIKEQLSKCFANPDQIFKWELRKVCKNGSVINVRELSRCVISSTGKKVAIIACEDITERKNSENLLLSEKRILELISQDEDLPTILEQICLAAEQQTYQMLCSFCLVDNTGKALVSCAAPSLSQDYAKDIGRLPIGPGIASCGTAAYTKKQVIVSNTFTDPLWADFRNLALNHNLQACWSTPILSIDGELLGTFAMYYPESRSPNEFELDIIERVAHLALIAIERKKSEEVLNKNLETLSKKSKYEEIISTVTRSVHSSLELDEVLENAVDAMHENIGYADNVGIFFVEGDYAVNKTNRGYSKELLKKIKRIPRPKGFTWKTILEGKLLYCSDAETDTIIGPAGKKEGTKSYACMPIKLKDKTIACICINSFQKNAFDNEDLRLLNIVAQQIGVAIKNANQAETIKKSEETLKENLRILSRKSRYEEVINAVSRSVHQSLELDDVFNNAVEAISKEIEEAKNVAIFMVEGDINDKENPPFAVMKASRGHNESYIKRVKRIPYPKGATWKAIIDGKTRYVPDTDKDDAIGPAGREFGTKSYLSMPLNLENETVGCIHIHSSERNGFSEGDIKLLEIVTRQLKTAINNASKAEAIRKSEETLKENLEQLSKKQRYEEIISTVTRSVHRSIDLNEVLKNAAEALDKNVDHTDHVAIYLVEGDTAILKSFTGYPKWFTDKVARIPKPKGFTWKTLIDGQPIFVPDVEKDGHIGPAGRKVGTKSYAAMPIKYNYTTIGCINISSRSLHAFDEDEMNLLEIVATQIETAINNANQAEALKTSREDLRESREHFRLLVETTNVIPWEADAKTFRFTYVGPQAEKLLGYPVEQWYEENFWLSCLHEDDREKAANTCATATAVLQDHELEYRFKTKEGKTKWLYEMVSVISENDEAKTLRGFMIDITERIESEQKLQSAFSEIEILKDKLEKENVYLKKEIELTYSHAEIIGQSKAIKSALGKIEQVAITDASVLLTGETGTGKELFANRIHKLSKRKDRAMVKVNCAALPPHLIESELFGHEKGAFTGAISRNIGRFEVADDSTIFLDEVGELPLELQSKLLRVLQEGEFQRVGSSKTTKVNVRVIAASNNELLGAVGEGNFREDLYYRLNVFPVNIPALKERKEDIPDLLWFFISEFEEKMDKTIKNISRKDMENLINYPWPGNVRQLRNVIERAMIISSGPDLQIELPGIRGENVTSEIKEMQEVEKDHISYILNMTNWRIRGKSGAAEILGLKPTTLESRIKKLGIKRGH